MPFIWMMSLSAFWSLILTFESAAPTIAEKVTWSQFEYFANIGISALMSYMCMLAYHNKYPLEMMIAYITTLYEMQEEQSNGRNT